MNKKSLRFQMVVVLIMLILIMLIFGHVMYAYFERQYSAKLLQINSDVAYHLADSIATQHTALRDALESFSVNTTVTRFLSTDSEYEKLTLMPLYESLQLAYKKMHFGLYSIVLKKKDGSIFSDPSGISEINISNTTPAFEQLESGDKTVLIINGSKAYIAIKEDVYQSGGIRTKVGSCMFVLAADSLMGNLKSQDSTSREVFVINDNQCVIAGNSDVAPGSDLPTSYSAYLVPGTENRQQIQDKEYIAVSQAIPDVEWTVLCITPKTMVFSELSIIQYTFYVLVGLMTVLVSLVYLAQELSISRAFRRLIAHINAIADGNQVQPVKLHDSMEFHQVSQAFNHMMQKLEELNRHNLESHEKILLLNIENKQSQLMALQSQINPHFLYNTLECINSAGAVCGSREVEEMSTALASIFRYACKGESIVTLQDELQTLHHYLNIQQIRFPNRFCIQYNIPEKLKTRRMLKFLLQPLVENSILHGFRECPPPWVIQVEAFEISNKLVVTVSDNGRGIKQDELQILNDRLASSDASGGSIGLMNIQRRIRLYYGEAFGLKIQSTVNQGTKIIAVLPAIENTQRGES